MIRMMPDESDATVTISPYYREGDGQARIEGRQLIVARRGSRRPSRAALDRGERPRWYWPD